jgi:hypothetical protein
MNNQLKSILFTISAVIVLSGSVLHFIKWSFAPIVFAIGALGLTVCYATEPQEGLSLRVRRLQRYNIYACLLMLGSAALMFKGGNEWVLCLSIAAFLQLYVSFIMPKAENKDE